MNYGISISVCFSKARELAQEGDLGKIYLNLLDYFTVYASQSGFKTIEIASFPPFDSSIINNIKGRIREKINKFETIYHLPSWEINIGALNPDIRRVSIVETKRLIEIVSEIGINKVSMHPGCYSSMSDIYRLTEHEVKAIARESVFDIYEYCKSRGMEMCLENLPYNELFFQRPEEFDPFIERGICMLLDTAHAVTSNVNPIEFIRRFGDRISEVHLVDGFKRKTDNHYALGKGETDYASILNELQKVAFKAPIILEMKSESDVTASLNLLRIEGLL